MGYLAIAAGYLLGSVPFGYLVCKYWKGLNILEHGSGNIGFTNVLRTVGWPPAALVLLGDVGKGAAAVWLGLKTGGDTFGILCGLAALLGHAYSVFLGFKGGKMVATGAGVLFMLAPKVALVAAAVWFITMGLFRYVSLASILAAVSLLPAMFVFNEPLDHKLLFAVVAVFLIYRHRSNIRKLLSGEEYRFGRKNGPK